MSFSSRLPPSPSTDVSGLPLDPLLCTHEELLEKYRKMARLSEKLGDLVLQSAHAGTKLKVALDQQAEELKEVKEWLASQTWQDTATVRRQADQAEQQAAQVRGYLLGIHTCLIIAQATRFRLAMDASAKLVGRLDDNMAYFIKGRDRAEKEVHKLRLQVCRL